MAVPLRGAYSLQSASTLSESSQIQEQQTKLKSVRWEQWSPWVGYMTRGGTREASGGAENSLHLDLVVITMLSIYVKISLSCICKMHFFPSKLYIKRKKGREKNVAAMPSLVPGTQYVFNNGCY